MPCRDSAIAGLSQYLARHHNAIDDVQMLSMYGELKRTPEALSAPPPTGSEWRAHCAQMARGINAEEGLTDARKARSRQVIADAWGTPPDGPTFYAMKQVEPRAAAARAAMDNTLRSMATEWGVQVSDMENAYKRLVAENRAIRRTDSPPTAQPNLGFDPSGIPADRATRWALSTLHYGGPAAALYPSQREHAQERARAASLRCDACGEFVGASGHLCPETSIPGTTAGPLTALTNEDDTLLRPWEEELLNEGAARDQVESEQLVAAVAAHQTSAPVAGDLPTRPATAATDVPTPTEPDTEPTPAQEAWQAVQRRRTSERRYRLESGYTLRTENWSGMTARLRDNGGQAMEFPLTVSTTRGPLVRGNVQVLDRNTPGRRWSSRRAEDRYTVSTDGRSLRCTCADYQANYDCIHVRESVEQMTAWLNEREPRPAVAPEQVVNDFNSELETSFAAANTATQESRAQFQAADEGISYADDMEAFQSDWDEARARFATGNRDITFMRENVTGGLSTRENGRSFGLEIEIDFPDDQPVYDGQEGRLGLYRKRRELAAAMHEAGVSQWNAPLPWHGLRRFPGRDGEIYTDEADRWSVQFDRSVDGMDGLRGAEIVSPILYDEPQTWDNLNTIVNLVKEHGGKVTVRTGLHVNVGGSDFNHTIENHNNLLKMADTFEDQLIRCATNPEDGGEWHRGRAYCAPVTTPAEGFQSISRAREANGHLSMVNLTAMPGERERVTGATRAEFRQFDGTLDVGRIQANTKMSLAMMDAAKRGVDLTDVAPERAGSHRARNHNGRRMPRLTGEQWEEDTKGFRRLADILFTRAQDKKQMVETFASSKWQKPV